MQLIQLRTQPGAGGLLSLLQRHQQTGAMLFGHGLPMLARDCRFQSPQQVEACRRIQLFGAQISFNGTQRAQLLNGVNARLRQHLLRLGAKTTEAADWLGFTHGLKWGALLRRQRTKAVQCPSA